jgi:transketolase
MRTAFINQLIKEAKTNEKIFLLVGDLGYSVVEPFAAAYPDRFLNVGIAEQNMTGIAAGLAMEGYNVFTYSIGNFPTLRCIEQIRYDVCYHNLSVKIVAVGGGYAYGPLGTSHHTTEDIAMLRAIPNMIVSAPADPAEAKALTTYFCGSNSPGYLRLGKAGEPLVHNEEIENITQFLPLMKGEKTAVLCTGGTAFQAKNFIEEAANKYSLYTVPIIKPINKNCLKYICDNYETIITVEEHQRSGGFGSAILEGINDLMETGEITIFPKVIRKAVPDIFIPYAGSQDFLKEKAGINLK